MRGFDMRDIPKDATITSAKIVTIDRLDGTKTEVDVTDDARRQMSDPIREIIAATSFQAPRYWSVEFSPWVPLPNVDGPGPKDIYVAEAIVEALAAAGYTIVHEDNVNQSPDCTWCKGPCRGGHPYD